MPGSQQGQRTPTPKKPLYMVLGRSKVFMLKPLYMILGRSNNLMFRPIRAMYTYISPRGLVDPAGRRGRKTALLRDPIIMIIIITIIITTIIVIITL